ncbi:glycerate kinase [Lactobacillus sp. PV034]|uniref:glycerate kinase family protein n=1 Tax=Lactobacillus sp. PV034 TaxID=2594495 RepID=UPI00223F095B|nr:glycerate kinase [Lactobacillus sp. PV034]QNQ81406.1 glycerate kinase [Lactobacillus sp. PV034]
MKIVIAPDSFKGSLTAKEVSQAIYAGIKPIFPAADYELIPMADGGEGTMETLVSANEGKILTTSVRSPLNYLVEAKYGLLENQDTAVIEMAQASGIQYITAETANPLIATTFGSGQLIKAALDQDVKKIIIGLGGSATNDGGAGMAQALGAKLLDRFGNEIPFGGGHLNDLDHIDITDLDPRLKNVKIILASDVKNPLTGKNGASAVFGPQKGATPEMVKILDQNLQHFAAIVKKDLHLDLANIPGAGAAGGLAFGLMAFAGAQLHSGIDLVLKETNFAQKVKAANLVFTGEGGTDFQTQYGKTPFGVAQLAKKIAPDCSVICLTGNIGAGIDQLYGDDKIDAIFATESGAKDLAQAMKDSSNDIKILSENIARLLKSYHFSQN